MTGYFFAVCASGFYDRKLDIIFSLMRLENAPQFSFIVKKLEGLFWKAFFIIDSLGPIAVNIDND